MNCTTIVARQDSCTDHEGPDKKGDLDSKTHTNQGRWTERPVQVGMAFSDTKSIAKHLDRMLEGDEEVSTMEFHHLIAKKFGKQAYAFI